MKVWESFVVMILLFALPALPLAFWTQNQLTFWVSHVKGVPTPVGWGVSYLASILWPLALVLDIVSQIIRLFV